MQLLPLFAALPFLSGLASALDPTCRPGGNFDLSKWELETSINNGNGQPLVISAKDLSGNGNGCANGWQDKGSEHQWFFTVRGSFSPVFLSRPRREPLLTTVGPPPRAQETTDGSLVMKAPGYSEDRPCIKWSGSNHCRTEFHEAKPASWAPTAGLNRLHVKLVGIRGSNVCIGQVFQVGGEANKPYAELYYHGGDGKIEIGVATCPGGANAGCGQHLTTLGKVPLNTPFSYDIRFEGNVLKAGINGAVQTLQTYFTTPGANFKVGNYNQGTDDSSVHLLELTTQHGS